MASPDRKYRIAKDIEKPRTFEKVSDSKLRSLLTQFDKRLPRHERYMDPGYFLATYYPEDFTPRPNQGEQYSGIQNLRNANIIPSVKSYMGNRLRYVETHENMLALAALYSEIKGAYSYAKHPSSVIEGLISRLGEDPLAILIKPGSTNLAKPDFEEPHPDTYTREMDIAARTARS